MEHLFGSKSIAACLLGRDLRVIRANAAAASVLGLETIAGASAIDLLPDAGAAIRECFDLAATGGALPDRQFTSHGRQYHVTFHAGPQCDELLVMALDVTKRAQVEHLLRESRRRLIATTRRDHLTDLLNRRGLETVLHRELRRARRADVPLSLLVIDIDWFKAYNDSLGHPRGDECLRDVAGALVGCLQRAGDAACRYGGEEFILVLPDTEIGGAGTVARNCQEAIDRLDIAHPCSEYGRVTVSFGIAQADPGARDRSISDDAVALLGRADSALYHAKRNGRNRIEFAAGR